MTLYPNSAALILAGLVRTSLAASKMGLYKAITSPLSPSTTFADLTEADYDGYAQKTITNFLPPYLDPAGGASIQSGTQQFDFDTDTSLSNVVLGFFLLTSGGDLMVVGSFDAPISMSAPGDSIPVNCTLNYGAPG